MTSQTRSPSTHDTELAALRRGHGRRHHGDQFMYFTIRAVAEMLEVSPRTVRRWIDKELLIAHRIAGVVRIAEGDFRAFLAAHRDN